MEFTASAALLQLCHNSVEKWHRLASTKQYNQLKTQGEFPSTFQTFPYQFFFSSTYKEKSEASVSRIHNSKDILIRPMTFILLRRKYTWSAQAVRTSRVLRSCRMVNAGVDLSYRALPARVTFGKKERGWADMQNKQVENYFCSRKDWSFFFFFFFHVVNMLISTNCDFLSLFLSTGALL